MVLGPPTTISESGVDYSLYLQGALNRDTTRFLWGFPLGQRDYFTVRTCLWGDMYMTCARSRAGGEFRVKGTKLLLYSPALASVCSLGLGVCAGGSSSGAFLWGFPLGQRKHLTV